MSCCGQCGGQEPTEKEKEAEVQENQATEQSEKKESE